MKISFTPSGEGTAQVLGELESAVLEQVWRNPESTARDVLDRLSGTRKLAYTTVVTVLDRLFKKGLVKRRRQGKAFVYRPGVSQQEFESAITRDVLAGLLKEDSRPTLSTFVELVSADEDLLAELEQLVRNRKPKG